MATLQELQKRLDEKTFNPAELNQDQRAAVDLAFESGQLKGYNSVSEIEKERSIASKVIAAEKEKRDQPFTVATRGLLPLTDEGIERSDLELVGDVGATVYQYTKDMPKIVNAFSKDTQVNLSFDKMRAAAMDFQKYERQLQKLPFLKGARILNRTARAAGKVIDGFRLVSKAPTQLLVTEAKSQVLSAGGAAGGSVLYDIANVATDMNVATNQDLAEVSDNDIKKLPYAQQVLVHAAEASRNAFYYNLAGTSLAPLLNVTMRGMKGFLGLGSKETKALAEAAEREGIQLSISSLADERSFGGRVIRFFDKTFGVVPIVNIFGKRQRAKVEQQVFDAFLNNIISKAPLEKTGLMNLKFLPTMKDNFMRYMNTIDVRYKTVDTIAEEMGNPKFIPIKGLKETAKNIVEKFEAGTAEPFKGKQTDLPIGQRVPEYKASMDKTSPFADTLFNFANKARGLDDYITPTEYQGLIRDLVKAAEGSKYTDMKNFFFTLKDSAVTDFNKVATKDNIQAYLNSAPFKTEYESILNSSGKQAADDYAKGIQNGMTDFGKELESANAYFSTVVSAFNNPVAQKVANTSANVFAAKAALNMEPFGKIQPDRMWEDTVSKVFQDPSVESLKELKFILGVNNPNSKLGTELYNRARTRFFFDAILKSYSKQPVLPDRTIGDIMDKARELGIINYKGSKEIFDAAGTTALEETKRIDPIMATKYQLGETDMVDLRLAAKQAGDFNLENFKKQLGLIRPNMSPDAAKKAAFDKFAEMYGGGMQGKEAARDLLKLVDIMDAEFGKAISDSNQYIMRRLMLSGVGQTAIGGAAFAGLAAGGIGAALPITALLAGTGYFLSNPKALKYMLDVYTDMQRFDKLGKQFNPANPPKSMMRLLNWAAEEDKDFPDVDPKKINFQEITDYLLNKNILIPELGFTPQAINPKLRNQFYPELKVIDKAPDAELAGGINYLKGANKGSQQAEAVINFQPPVSNQQAPIYNQFVDPRYLPQQPAQTTVTPQNYNMLFPNDALGQAIAERGQQQ
jgi:hypothetical protein